MHKIHNFVNKSWEKVDLHHYIIYTLLAKELVKMLKRHGTTILLIMQCI